MNFAHSKSYCKFRSVAYFMPIEEWVWIIWPYGDFNACDYISYSVLMQQRKLISIFAYRLPQIT